MPGVSDLVILHEHPTWQSPLFAALERRGVTYTAVNARAHAFDPGAPLSPTPLVVFNQSSPSAYTRAGAERAVPLTLALLTALEHSGARVLNGSRAFALELSKSAQAALLLRLRIAHPRSLAFNDVGAALRAWPASAWPALLKPEQGGSGARIFLLQSGAELTELLRKQPTLWHPDGLLLLQEYFPPRDVSRGIIRIELLGGKMLYAMRVVSHGAFNLCPSIACNPGAGDKADEDETSVCAPKPAKPVEFYPFNEVPPEAVEAAERIAAAAGLDVCGIEYLEADDGRLIFYDVRGGRRGRGAGVGP